MGFLALLTGRNVGDNRGGDGSRAARETRTAGHDHGYDPTPLSVARRSHDHRMRRHLRDAILGAVLALAAGLMLVSTVEAPSILPANLLPVIFAPIGPPTPVEVVPPVTSPRPVG
jgi:hypothetical protein